MGGTHYFLVLRSGRHLRFHSVCPSKGKSPGSFHYSCHITPSHDAPAKFYYFLRLFFCQECFRYVYNIKINIKNSILCNAKFKKLGKVAAQFVGNKAKGRISKRVLQENKARQISRKTNISYPLIRTRTCAYQGVRKFRFSGNLACFVFL